MPQQTSVAVIDKIYRYPIKGLGGEELPQAILRPGCGIAHDRCWGLATREWDELFQGDKWRPWEYCLSLKKKERPALLSISVREDLNGAPILAVSVQGKEEVSGHPEKDKARLEMFFRDFLQDDNLSLREAKEPVWDERNMHLSVLNLNSVRDLSGHMQNYLSPLRFRANILIKNASAWKEKKSDDMLINTVTLTLGGDVPRCAATQVNPKTALRDANVPAALVRHYGHNNMGVYAVVKNGGPIAAGMEAHF